MYVQTEEAGHVKNLNALINYKMNIHIIHTIKLLSEERQELYKTYEDSYDESIGDFGEYLSKWDPKIDDLGDKIHSLLKEFHSELPLDLVLEELTKLGHSPSLLYDDNGHWCIACEGYQSVSPGDGPADTEAVYVIKEEEWSNSINEAIDKYFVNE